MNLQKANTRVGIRMGRCLVEHALHAAKRIRRSWCSQELVIPQLLLTFCTFRS